MTTKEDNTLSAEERILAYCLGNAQPNGRCPAQIQITKELNIHLRTVGVLMRGLVLAGRLVMHPGKGYFLAGVLDPAEMEQLELEDAGPVELVKVGDQSIPTNPAEAARVIQRLRTAAAMHQAENERLKAELRLLKLARSNGELQRDLEHEQQRARDLGRDYGRALAAVRFWAAKCQLAECRAGLPITPWQAAAVAS